jgi:HAMP domain-containing protein
MIAAETGTSWPDAAITIAGIALSAVFVFVVVSQVFATWRARVSAAREDAYRKLAEQATEAERRTADGLERTASELGELRARTAELERMLKEVE